MPKVPTMKKERDSKKREGKEGTKNKGKKRQEEEEVEQEGEEEVVKEEKKGDRKKKGKKENKGGTKGELSWDDTEDNPNIPKYKRYDLGVCGCEVDFQFWGHNASKEHVLLGVATSTECDVIVPRIRVMRTIEETHRGIRLLAKKLSRRGGR